jgi:anti-sigma B factor antagonist
MPVLSQVRAEGGREPTHAKFGISERALDEVSVLITVEGELDLATAPRLKWPLVDAIDGGARVLIVDLSGVTFMDSTALGVLIGIRRTLKLGSRMAIVCTDAGVLKIFEISGLDAVFQIFPTFDEALSYASEGVEPRD